MIKIALIVAVVLIVGLLGWIFFSNQNNNQQSVSTQPVEKRQEEPRKEKEAETSDSTVSKASPKAVASSSTSGLANPASVNCTQKGGTLQIMTNGSGGQYGVCMFEDDQECEEWALYRGNCPVGGIKTIGYDTPQEVYCAITGGQTTATANASCKLPNGHTCSLNAYYNGTCS